MKIRKGCHFEPLESSKRAEYTVILVRGLLQAWRSRCVNVWRGKSLRSSQRGNSKLGSTSSAVALEVLLVVRIDREHKQLELPVESGDGCCSAHDDDFDEPQEEPKHPPGFSSVVAMAGELPIPCDGHASPPTQRLFLFFLFLLLFPNLASKSAALARPLLLSNLRHTYISVPAY